MPNGKEIDKSTPWSAWTWDDRGYYYSSRYDPLGNVQYEYRSPETSSQQQKTPRTPGESPIQISAPNPSSAPYLGGSSSPISNKTENYQSQSTNSYSPDSNYTTATAAASQSSSYGVSGSSYASQSSRSASSSSNPTSLSPYGGSTISPNLSYTSSSSNSSCDASASGMTSAFAGMSMSSVPPTIPEQGYVPSTSYQPLTQPPSNYIARPPNSLDKEKLDPRYRCIGEKEQRKFWKVGRVFMMLWTEPAAQGSTRNGTHYSTVWLEQGAYSEIRRFVVIKEGYGNSICSPIHTYNGQATLKPNLPERQQHAIIYTSKECPPEHSYTASDRTFVKENLSKDPIKVRREQSSAEGDLGVFSRLNYSKIYTVENYVRVLNIGIVERDWIPTLQANSYVRPSDVPVEKPTKWTSNDSNDRDKKSKGKRKDTSSRRTRR